MAPTEHQDDKGGLSIGALAQAVGIPVPTLRTWENRYGYPSAVRLASGHRRFSPDAVERLRLVLQLLDRGHPASAVVPADLEALRARLALGRAAPADVADRSAGDMAWDAWFGAVDRFDVRELEAHLHQAWNRAGAIEFLERDLATFLAEVGRRWRVGRLDVAREHCASAAVTQFLARKWRAMSDAATGPVAVFATFPSELHELGLHMAAITLSLAGWRIRFLGSNTPVASIAGAAGGHPVGAVVIGASPAADPAVLRDNLRELQANLPANVVVWVGGIEPVEAEGLADWPRSLSALYRAAQAASAP